MYVRLANAWTDQHGARHQAGDTVEVDNVTLAELEAGGFVTTNDDEQTGVKPAGWMGPGSEPVEETKAKAKTTESGESGGGDDGIAKPDSDGWPGIG